jgi:AraC-like DNA-binding protein
MNIRIAFGDSDPMVTHHDHPAFLENYKIPHARVQAVSLDIGYLLLQERTTDHATLQTITFASTENKPVVLEQPQPTIALVFALENTLSLHLTGYKDILFPEGTFNLFYLPPREVILKTGPSPMNHLLLIHFPIENIRQLATYYPTLEQFMQWVNSDEPALLYPNNPFAKRDMIELVKDLAGCSYNNDHYNWFFLSKSNELLLQMLELYRQPDLNGKVKMRNGDLQSISELKRDIDNDPGNGYSLQGMSRKTGLNKNKLQQAFKYLTGLSLFDYIRQVRMVYAKNALEKTDISIEDVGYAIGYETQASFCKAFKLYYGITPSDLRKRN